MSLREEVELYSKLTGKDGTQEPIVRIGAYLDGYEKGKEDAEPHWIPVTEATPTEDDEYWCTFGAETGWFVDWCDWYQGRWVVWTDNTVSEVRNVIAWCKPLEPYKGVTDGND